MRWLLTGEHVLSWREPGAFLQAHGQRQVAYSWRHHFFLLAFLAFFIFLWWLKPDFQAIPLAYGLVPGLILGVVATYALPTILYFLYTASMHRNYVALSRGRETLYIKFDGTWSWEIQPHDDYWLLRFTNFENKEELVALPTEKVMEKAERILVRAGIPSRQQPLSPHNEGNDRLASTIISYQSDVRKLQSHLYKWWTALAVANLVFYYFNFAALSSDEVLLGIYVCALFVELGLVLWIEVILKKRIAKKMGLVCRHCWKTLGPISAQMVYDTHVCPRCFTWF